MSEEMRMMAENEWHKTKAVESALLKEIEDNTKSAEGKAACAQAVMRLWNEYPALHSADRE